MYTVLGEEKDANIIVLCFIDNEVIICSQKDSLKLY